MSDTKYQYWLQKRNGRRCWEGPWESAIDALRFFDAEVGGAVMRVVRIVPQTGQIIPQTKWLAPTPGAKQAAHIATVANL